jgi:hypothetical protein
MKLKLPVKIEKSGVDRKRAAILGGLLVVLLLAYLFNRSSGGGDSEPVAKSRPAAAPAQTGFDTYGARPAGRASNRLAREGSGRILGDFQPTMKPKGVDPSSIDPTLHLDELAKLQNVKVEGPQRSLFKFSEGQAAAGPQLAKIKEPDKIKPIDVMVGPKPAPPPPPPPPPPTVAAIPLKFYGFVNPKKTGDKRAFFLDGEDIIVAREGDMIKKRYKIVHIGVSSAVVEDTQAAAQAQNNPQTLPLVQEQNS